LYKGIPNALRTFVWDKMLADMWARQSPPLGRPYNDQSFEVLYVKPSSHERQIDLDVERTLRNHVLFKLRFGTGQSSLFKILVALANQNPDVGYCQGMSTVAAFFLLYFDEERAFRHLRTLFRSQELDRLYAHHFPKLFETFFIHEHLLSVYYPKLLEHLEYFQIGTSIYATRWYLTLFLGLPYMVAARVWDLFLFFGFDILLHAGITLLSYFSDKILKSHDFEKIMEILSRCEEQDINPDKFIKILKSTWMDSAKSEVHSVPYLRSLYFIETNKTSPLSAQFLPDE
jgi:Rab-GTPase-TBC domain